MIRVEVQKASVLVNTSSDRACDDVKSAIIELRKMIAWGDITVDMVGMSDDGGMVMLVTAAKTETHYHFRIGRER